MPINADITGTDDGETISGSAAGEVVDAGGGLDTVLADDGADTIFAGANRDKVWGEEGEDELYGNGGNDRIYGGDDNDRIIGGGDDDVLYGDTPHDNNDNEGFSDTFVFGDNDGNDKILDFESGIDFIEFTDGGSVADLTFEHKGEDTTIITYGDTVITVFDAHLDASSAEFIFV
ncbi:hypothetical protein [Roseobacter sp.]|uniref:calcium-binding protein n=1 Tax=Roseobacter sp. TaxID=1907202 RepID=UPI00329956BC